MNDRPLGAGDARRAIEQARKVVAIWRSVEDLAQAGRSAKEGQAPAVPALLRGQLRLLAEILEGRR